MDQLRLVARFKLLLYHSVTLDVAVVSALS
jgi:hypothetical protein